MSFHEQNLAKLSNWKFIEMWVDPTHDLPYILMLVGDVDGSYSLYDPTEGYKVVYSARNYEAVKDFLLEDEYVQIRDRYQDLDFDVSTPSLVLENKSRKVQSVAMALVAESFRDCQDDVVMAIVAESFRDCQEINDPIT